MLPGRSPGLHLSAEGRAQAESTADALATLRRAPVAVYASPLERTRETAKPIAERFGLTVRIERGLLECDVGDWTGKSLSALRRSQDFKAVQHLPSSFRFPGGESFAQMQARIVDTIDNLTQRHHGESIVCVTHADPIRAAVAATAGVPLDLFQRIIISPCSMSALVRGRSGFAVLCVNATTSLSELVLS